jgi:hypothetical protein
MENKKGEVALNDKLLDMVSGGIPVGGPSIPCCSNCGSWLDNGICKNSECSHSPYYQYPFK